MRGRSELFVHPAFVRGVVAELQQPGLIPGLDIPLFGGDLHQRIEVRKAVIDDAGLFQALKPLFMP